MHTEINERGPSVSVHELELFREKLMYLAKGASICVFAGSLPRGIDQDVYASLIRAVRKLGATTIVDTDGEPLRLAVKAEPDVVSPNEAEAEELVGYEFNDDQDRAGAVDEIARLGPAEAIMTVADGCYAQVIESGAPVLYRVSVAELEPRSRIGSGDAFLAGYVAARYGGQAASRLPAVRGCVWRRVDPAHRCRRVGARQGRAAARRGEGGTDPRPGRDLLTAARPARAGRGLFPGVSANDAGAETAARC